MFQTFQATMKQTQDFLSGCKKEINIIKVMWIYNSHLKTGHVYSTTCSTAYLETLHFSLTTSVPRFEKQPHQSQLCRRAHTTLFFCPGISTEFLIKTGNVVLLCPHQKNGDRKMTTDMLTSVGETDTVTQVV